MEMGVSLGVGSFGLGGRGGISGLDGEDRKGVGIGARENENGGLKWRMKRVGRLRGMGRHGEMGG